MLRFQCCHLAAIVVALGCGGDEGEVGPEPDTDLRARTIRAADVANSGNAGDVQITFAQALATAATARRHAPTRWEGRGKSRRPALESTGAMNR